MAVDHRPRPILWDGAPAVPNDMICRMPWSPPESSVGKLIPACCRTRSCRACRAPIASVGNSRRCRSREGRS
jgi:hypothetical protein